MKKALSLLAFMSSVQSEFRSRERYGTAHVYCSVIRSVSAYAGSGFPLCDLSASFLKGYEDHLIFEKKLSWNTSSTYMRCLQSVYNRALRSGHVPFVPHLFKEVFTGVKRNHRRALCVDDLRRLVCDHPSSSLSVSAPASPSRAVSPSSSSGISVPCRVNTRMGVSTARAYLELMLRFQGMCFVDLAFLRKSDLKDGYLCFRRHKTRMPLCIRMTDESRRLLLPYLNHDPSSPYLLRILNGRLRGYASYRDYQKQLRLFNTSLKQLARERQVFACVSTYCARHSWATQAKYCGIPPSVISEGLGHASVTTTEAYLKSFESGVLDQANAQVMDYIFHGKQASPSSFGTNCF